jgi:NAD(P)-dependent dehydrogenase (short-subunit alcohol dehydrogenase family)
MFQHLYLCTADQMLGGTKGIGRGMVEAFVKQGCQVSYCARTVNENDFTKLNSPPFNEQHQETPPRAYGTSVDITNRDALSKWVVDSAARVGRIDIVIANGLYT